MTIDQLDLTQFQLSPSLSNLVVGRHDFPEDMQHQDRVMKMYALIKAYAFVRDLGELEHTGDWDWRIIVNTTDGLMPSPAQDGWMCDEIQLRYTAVPNDYQEFFSRWEYLIVELIDDQGRLSYEHPFIDHVRSITIEVL